MKIVKKVGGSLYDSSIVGYIVAEAASDPMPSHRIQSCFGSDVSALGPKMLRIRCIWDPVHWVE